MTHPTLVTAATGFLMLMTSFTAVAADAKPGVSLETRVAAQKAIDDVYWKHTEWPRDNPQPKPGLDAVLSDSDIRFKIQDYLRKSDALASSWHGPITAEDLQAEIDRMADETRDAAVLRELWNALGNDPLLIAECLARPALVDRFAQQLDGFDDRVESAHHDSATDIDTPSTSYRLPEIRDAGTFDPFVPQSAGAWRATTTTGAPTGRVWNSSVWTGTLMIVWGGVSDTGGKFVSVNTGGRYNPATNTWSATTTVGAPSARYYHTAVWTGTQMIVWGGGDPSDGLVNTGGRYNPLTNTWTATRTAGAPTGRGGHTAVWTGTRMIVWGGADATDAIVNTGGRYNPSTNTWIATKTAGAPPARYFHAAVWTGTQMIVWGGVDGRMGLRSGGRYNPSTNSWTAMSLAGAPSERRSAGVVWAGTQMIVWGGYGGSGVLKSGGRYNPTTNTWTATALTGAPAGRGDHTTVWTGTTMLVWGGYNGTSVLKSGGRYNPSTNTWTATSLTGAPAGRGAHGVVWTGTRMIVWGGTTGKVMLKSGGLYTP